MAELDDDIINLDDFEPLKHQGIKRHRFEQNPEEERFAEEWERFAQSNLKYLVNEGDQHFVPDPTQEQATVAATVIQWLGSPSGQGFLEGLGYKRVDPEDPDGETRFW